MDYEYWSGAKSKHPFYKNVPPPTEDQFMAKLTEEIGEVAKAYGAKLVGKESESGHSLYEELTHVKYIAERFMDHLDGF